MSQVDTDDIGLLDFFETLWNGKGIIISFIVATLVSVSIYINLVEPEYESKIIYSVDVIPPFYSTSDQRIPIKDFNKLFYNQSLFDDWKKNNQNSLLMYNDFTNNIVVGNVLVNKPDKIRTAILDKDEDIGAFILVKSNQLRLLDDFYNYAGYINDMLTKEYILRAREEINIINKRSNDFGATTDIITSKLLAVDRYIMEAEKGANVFLIYRPEIPIKAWPRVNLLIVVAVMLGIFLGITYLMFREAIRIRKESKHKSKNTP